VQIHESSGYRLDDSSSDQFTILNANIWLLPGPLAADRVKRLRRFVAFARERRPDVITLQEVWTAKHVRRIASSLPDYEVSTCGMGPMWNRGGLLTLSRHRSVSSRFVRFAPVHGHGWVEWVAGKGYLTTVVDLPTGPAAIVNVHLYAPTRPERVFIAEDQLDQVLDLSPEHPHVVVGDMNLPAEHVDHCAGSRFHFDDAQGHTIDPHNHYTQWGFNSVAAGSKIDRLLIPSELAAAAEIHSTVVAVPTVSDHYMTSYRIPLDCLASSKAASRSASLGAVEEIEVEAAG